MLPTIPNRSRAAFVKRIADGPSVPWWTAVVVTAGSARQADWYSEEIRRRREQGKLPGGVLYLALPDPGHQKLGSGGATLNALRALRESTSDPWENRRVLVLHAGGDSRRLPQYSLSGKLFSALPVKTPWGDVSTVFDELLALSSAWAAQMHGGFLACSGDVLPTFEAEQLSWERPGVCGVAIRQPVEAGALHGVYVADEHGRVYSFLQKPAAAQVRAAGGLLPGGLVALDTGLLRFDAETARRLERVEWPPEECPPLDLYEHFTRALTGERAPESAAHPLVRVLEAALRGVPFWCSVVGGEFVHVGATPLFRRLLTEETNFSRIYEAQQRLGTGPRADIQSAGVVVDCVFRGGGSLGPGAVAIECDLDPPVRLSRGAIIHGLEQLNAPVELPEDTVAHQVSVALPDRTRGTVIRVWGVDDDPKGLPATWFSRPLVEVLLSLGLREEEVWPGVSPTERTLWNAELFPLAEPGTAWACARWMLGFGAEQDAAAEQGYSAAEWRKARRLSLGSSVQWADAGALAMARSRRMQAGWKEMALSLARSGTDVRPLLAHAPGVFALAETGRTLASEAVSLEAESPAEAASRFCQASLFLAQAGMAERAEAAHASAFAAIRRACGAGSSPGGRRREQRILASKVVSVSAPARIDLGGGWSDTPPFCFDWGGTVLNIALEINGCYPVRTTVERIGRSVIRLIVDDEAVEYCDVAELTAATAPGSPYAIPRVALQMWDLVRPGEPLGQLFTEFGGGLEIRTTVDLPLGSGLGTSSILAATVIRALGEILGEPLGNQELSDWVMRLEQLMTTGGGWQDQAGGIFPGAKLISSGPGLRQRLRVQPVAWSPERQHEMMSRFVFYYTGIRRIAKNLLTQVVGSYLAREADTVQVLHSIKTLAVEMAYAMAEGDWEYLGHLLNRHWELNMILDPHTTNAPITALLDELRPYLAGAKLAGAGGGGFLLLLAKDPDAAAVLRDRLSAAGSAGTALRATEQPFRAHLPGGAVYGCAIATEGLRVTYGRPQ